MKVSNAHFHLCKIFIDETRFPKNKEGCFMWGGIFLPVDCDVAIKLGKVRKREGFVNTIHFSNKSTFNNKEIAVIKGFLEAFLDSNACFRSIVVGGSSWEDMSDWRSMARLAGLLLSYPWIPCEGEIFRVLSRARIIFDRSSLNSEQEDNFLSSLNRMLKIKNKVFETPARPIADSSIVFANKRIFDELQLVDVLNGIIRVGYLEREGREISKSKLDLYNYLLKKFPQTKSFVDANREKTRQKIDVWEFTPTAK